MDHAAVCPIPSTAVRALQQYGERIANNGLADISFWVERVAAVRQLAANLINAPSVDDVCFIPNTTTGIGMIAEGYPWQAGDNLILASEEYPSNQYPWLNLQSRGVQVRSVPTVQNRIRIDDIRQAIDTRTRLITCSYVQFSSGFRSDLDKIGELCREHQLFFFVDAIQGLGALPIDVQKTPIDALAADGHKWLLGPEGAGFAYIRRDWVERLHPIGIGAHSVVKPFEYTTIDLKLKPHAGRWEGGALNLPGITALGESLQLFQNIGKTAIEQRVLALTDYLCEQAPRAQLEVFSSRDAGERSGIVSMHRIDTDSKLLLQKARAHGIMINMRAGRLRVSPHFYNSYDEIDQFIDSMR